MALSEQLHEALMPADTPEIVAARDALRTAKAEVDRLKREAIALYNEPASDPRVKLNRTQARDAERAADAAGKAYREAIKTARLAPAQAAKLSRTKKLAVCQICSLGFELRNLVLVHHGWREHGAVKGQRGFRHGVCPGAGYSPMQVSCARARSYAHELRITIARIEENPDPDAAQRKSVVSMRAMAEALESEVARWKADDVWIARTGYRVS